MHSDQNIPPFCEDMQKGSSNRSSLQVDGVLLSCVDGAKCLARVRGSSEL